MSTSISFPSHEMFSPSTPGFKRKLLFNESVELGSSGSLHGVTTKVKEVPLMFESVSQFSSGPRCHNSSCRLPFASLVNVVDQVPFGT